MNSQALTPEDWDSISSAARTTARRFWKYLPQWLRRTTDADDLAQAAMIAVHKCESKYVAGQCRSAGSFFDCVIRSAIIDELRAVGGRFDRKHNGRRRINLYCRSQIDGGRSGGEDWQSPFESMCSRDTRLEFELSVEPIAERIAGHPALRSVPEHVREILGDYCSGQTMKEIAKSKNLSESRISQVMTEAKKVVSESVRPHQLIDYDV